MRVKATTTLFKSELWAARKKQGAECYNWFIFFLEAHRSQRAWWHVFCREGFGHILSLRYNPENDRWIKLDWNGYCLDAGIVTDAEVELIFGQLYVGGAHCVKFRPRWRKTCIARSILLYCVSATKHLLGVTSWAVTPYQLYCYLLANGGTEVFPAGKTE